MLIGVSRIAQIILHWLRDTLIVNTAMKYTHRQYNAIAEQRKAAVNFVCLINTC